MKNIEIHQIFYNDKTRTSVKPPFIPLDNTLGEKSWFEFWPILNFLNKNELREDTLYGFVSPKFTEKTGITPAQAIQSIQARNGADVLLFSYKWDLLSYFLNPWEQGEIWHPGITRETQKFLYAENIQTNLKYLITSCRSSVFSNFIVANKKYWSIWKAISTKFYIYANNPYNEIYMMNTTYMDKQYPMKVFIQERFPTLILSLMRFKTEVIDCLNTEPSSFIQDTAENRTQLRLCDQLKDQALSSQTPNVFLKNFLEARSKIVFSGGVKLQGNHAAACG